MSICIDCNVEGDFGDMDYGICDACADARIALSMRQNSDAATPDDPYSSIKAQKCEGVAEGTLEAYRNNYERLVALIDAFALKNPAARECDCPFELFDLGFTMDDLKGITLYQAQSALAEVKRKHKQLP